jgi:uncharacterized protein YyaL (SSP411 family)
LLGLVTLLSNRWRSEDVAFAQGLAETVMEQFYDVEAGGFYFTPADQAELIFRPKPSFDEALPPGNATMCRALFALGQLLGNTTYLDAATNTLRWARAAMERYPANHCSFVTALQSSIGDQTVVLRGPEEKMASWHSALVQGYKPWLTVFCVPFGIEGPMPAYLPALVSAGTREKVSAYVFEDGQASAAIHELADLTKLLGS